jgi:hypothetical protein
MILTLLITLLADAPVPSGNGKGTLSCRDGSFCREIPAGYLPLLTGYYFIMCNKYTSIFIPVQC